MLLRLFWLFLKLAFLSFGGGYPMMALILEMGEADVGLTAAEFADMAALELLASGPIALNAATYIGYIKAGVLGSLVATAGVCLPPFALAGTLFYFVDRFRQNEYMEGFLTAIKLACGGILVTTVWTLSREILLGGLPLAEVAANPAGSIQWFGLLIIGICLLAILRFKVNPIIMILVAAGLGVLLL